MAIKLFVTDMDGTLLNGKKEISTGNIKAIRQAVDDGMVFTICTGRMYTSTVPYAKSLGIDEVPIITYNGALIKTLGGREIFSKFLAPELCLEVLEYAAELGEYCQTYSDDKLYYREHCAESEFYEKHTATVGYAVGDDIVKYVHNTPKMLMIGKDEAATDVIVEKLNNKFGGRLQAMRSAYNYVEIMPLSVSKANAMLKLAEILGIDQKDVLAIGDSDNDISMIKAAGVGVAVANCTDNVRNVAKYFVASNEDDGITEAINRFFYEK